MTKLYPRKFDEGGGFAQWGAAGSKASSKFGSFMQSGAGQAALSGLDIGSSLLNMGVQKRQIAEAEKKAIDRNNFYTAVNASVDKRAKALQIAQQYDQPGSSALATAQASLQNIPEYTEQGKPQMMPAGAMDKINSGIRAGFSAATATAATVDTSDPGKVEVPVKEEKPIIAQPGKDPQTTPTGSQGQVSFSEDGSKIKLRRKFESGGWMNSKGAKIGAAVAQIGSGLVDAWAGNKVQKAQENLNTIVAQGDAMRDKTMQLLQGVKNPTTPSAPITTPLTPNSTQPIQVQIVPAEPPVNTGTPVAPSEKAPAPVKTDAEVADEVVVTPKKEEDGGKLKKRFQINQFKK